MIEHHDSMILFYGILTPKHGRDLKTVRRLFIPRPKGSGAIAMSLASVRFVSALSLENRLEYFDDTLQLCRTGHNDVSHTKIRALALIFFIVISPLMLFMHVSVRSVT